MINTNQLLKVDVSQPSGLCKCSLLIALLSCPLAGGEVSEMEALPGLIHTFLEAITYVPENLFFDRPIIAEVCSLLLVPVLTL